jgi:Tol biopolymer transport system component
MGKVWRVGYGFTVCLVLAMGSGPSRGAADLAPPLIRSPVRFLTQGAEDLWPCFSPDSAQILFSRRVGQGWELFIVPVRGGQAVQVIASNSPVAATRANWSKASNVIAFAGSSTAGESQVWLMNSDGSNSHAVELSGLSEKIFYPSWYPDGKRLAVMDGDTLSMKRIDLGKGTVTALTDPKRIYTGMPSVSPDGKWIAFAGQENRSRPYDQTKNSIWLMEDSGVPRLLESSGKQGRAPTWSPSGEQLLFESDRASSVGLYVVFLINRDGTGITQLTDPALNADHPVWSADGRHIAFSAHDPAQSPGRRGIGIIDLPKVEATGSDQETEGEHGGRYDAGTEFVRVSAPGINPHGASRADEGRR